MLPARMNWMKSLVFEGNTWEIYEALRTQDKQLHKKLAPYLGKCCVAIQLLVSASPSRYAITCQGYGRGGFPSVTG